MLRAPPLPSSSITGVKSLPTISSCQKYRASLQKQLLGQTPLLDDVLAITLRHARNLQEDFGIMRGDDEQTWCVPRINNNISLNLTLHYFDSALVSRLAADCQPDIEQFAAKVLDALDSAVNSVKVDTGKSMRKLCVYALLTSSHRLVSQDSSLCRTVG